MASGAGLFATAAMLVAALIHQELAMAVATAPLIALSLPLPCTAVAIIRRFLRNQPIERAARRVSGESGRDEAASQPGEGTLLRQAVSRRRAGLARPATGGPQVDVARRMLENGLRGVNLAREALPSEKKLAEALALPFDGIVLAEPRAIVDQIRSLNRSIAELEKTIPDEGSKLEGHKNLTSIKGAGKIASAIFPSVTRDVNDFPGEGRLASCCGTVPRVANSNETMRRGRIHKRGSKLGRRALRRWRLSRTNRNACTNGQNGNPSSEETCVAVIPGVLGHSLSRHASRLKAIRGTPELTR